jgi:hypothetical protein
MIPADQRHGNPLKYSKSVVFSGLGKSFTDEKKTAGMVGNGQRIAVAHSA